MLSGQSSEKAIDIRPPHLMEGGMIPHVSLKRSLTAKVNPSSVGGRSKNGGGNECSSGNPGLGY